jgi:hypothetical protein
MHVGAREVNMLINSLIISGAGLMYLAFKYWYYYSCCWTGSAHSLGTDWQLLTRYGLE